MSTGLIGRKIGMTQFYLENGEALAVSVVDVSGNQVVQIKTKENDGYSAVQLGFAEKKPSRVTQPLRKHFEKYGATPKYVVREFPLKGEAPVGGAVFGPESFEKGQFVDVSGVTKGLGFQGVVKRYNFRGQPMTHGSMMHRRPGSIGCRLTPGLVWKNQKMPGRHGGYNRTTQSLEIVQVRAEDGVILIKGSIPGHKGAYVIVRPAIKRSAVKKK